MRGSSPRMTQHGLADSLTSSYQHLATNADDGFRHDPSVKQIEIDIAAAQDEADPLAADFLLFLQGGGERRGAGAFGEVMRIGPIGPHRRANLVVGDLHDA